MKSRSAAVLSLALAVACPALAADALMLAAQAVFKPLPSAVPALPGNAASPGKLQLGRMLYFDPRLSASHSISCNSCHNVGLGGVDSQETSIGHHWQRGTRNSPTVFNAVFNTAQFWDGRAKDLEAQAGGPMVNPLEMASPTAHVAEQLAAIPGYVTAFKAAFPGEAVPVSLGNAQRALAVFEATLITPNAAFDRYLRGQGDALTDRQKSGLALFMDRGCAACHNGINIGGGMYAPFGVVEKPDAQLLPPGDAGRFAVTKAAGDRFVFKVPTLRNITLTAPYFHTGKSWDLRQAVAVMGKSQLGANLSSDEIDRVVSFLDSLIGTQPTIEFPTLPPNVTSSPHPAR